LRPPESHHRIGLTSGARLTRAFLVLFFFISYLVLYLLTIDLALQKIAVLKAISDRFIPAYRNFIPGFNYVGFVVPLAIALFVLLLILRESGTSLQDLRSALAKKRFWLVAALFSIGVWYLIPGFASGGHTDFPLAVVTCVYVGWNLDEGKSKRCVLTAVVLGFGIGLFSDLQSQTYFTGIFGGWGLADGDLLGTIALPLATLTTLALLHMIHKPEKDDVSKSRESAWGPTSRTYSARCCLNDFFQSPCHALTLGASNLAKVFFTIDSEYPCCRRPCSIIRL
jgi:hypothetical protein